ncbi:uncharacterized protein LOC119683280 isoform X2 [Teleopsis dalmanni]|uniref:uncharacterized protein LOC119683280 isoform X2 n=1 Tax=Teleopsis dalmanni TaxID=139649 RepID=UPI0018CCAB04|nr:uncharacterized protein LOC119683280 isoform X2 [Teleopsis dalmanni]
MFFETFSVRSRLVPVISFLYVGPGREIIKEGDPPRYVYFILTGEVEVMEKTWNAFENEFVEEIISVIGPGDCIGDIEFIEQCLRRNTYTTRNNCELLVVFEDDFDRVLRVEMTKLWMEKKAAFDALPYFSHLNASQLQRGCKMAQLRQFEPLETIYYEDKGHVSPVYFIVSGECMILQCLKLKVTEFNEKKSYELVDISDEKQEGLFQTDEESSKKPETKEDDDFDIETEIKSIEGFLPEPVRKLSTVDNPEVVAQKKPKRVIEIKNLQEIEMDCLRLDADRPYEETDGLGEDEDDEEHEAPKKKPSKLIEKKPEINQQSQPENEEVTTGEGDGEEEEMKESAVSEDGVKEADGKDVDNKTDDATEGDGANVKVDENDMNELSYGQASPEDIAKSKVNYEEEYDDSIGTETELKSELTGEMEEVEEETDVTVEESLVNIEEKSESEILSELLATAAAMKTPKKKKKIIKKSGKESKELQIRYESRFIDVGSLLFGGIFGLGEKLQHRVIMARSTVQCLLVPRYWLFEPNQNPGNIWQRRRFYLNTSIPSRENLFIDFLREKEWRKFKNEVVSRVLEDAVSGNTTKVQDIPIICRIIEDSGDD